MATETEAENPEAIDLTTDDIKGKETGPMRIITVNVPTKYIHAIESAVKNGFCCSRSELVRDALGHYLRDVITEVNEKLEVFSVIQKAEAEIDWKGKKWHVIKK